ncbi:MAG: TIR domain-containing protein, partial [bacterium]|nr:TIR domain-containing protein [bacterium]
MARIFLSHSSTNNAEAIVLRDWLVAEGWDDLFLDLDPQRGIVAGERWERALNEAANRCEAVLFLVSKAWLASAWCLKEFHLAAKLNKRMFGLLIEDLSIDGLPAEVTTTWQLVDLAAGSDHQMFRAELPDGSETHVTYSKAGLSRLKGGLTKAGLDARFFAWPPEGEPNRPPYRGLRPLEAEDAGIFFGREAPTIETLDRLRGLSEGAPPRFLVILGASGAGKSSFLRAGLLPRLRRDDRVFLPLPIVRPEGAAITGETGLLCSLETACKTANLKRTRAEIKAAIESGVPAVSGLLDELAKAAAVPELDEAQSTRPRLVLAVDQGEELFLAEGADEAHAFLDLTHALIAAVDSNVIVLFTIRSDAFEYLQAAPALDGLHQNTLSLPPLPRGAYQTVIEGPAARLRDIEQALTIEPALTEALLADIEEGGAKDALPLLAFTLERLFLEHGGDGDLKLAEYRAIGGTRGSIEAAVERALKAADADPAVPKDGAARLALLRRALIPWLAGIDPETGAPRRRVARLSEIPEEARPLVNHLIAARLLATDLSSETGERTVEPAHEALLRQWSLLEGWLEEDFAVLSTLEAAKRAARDWEANSRHEAWLAHTAGRLDDAEALLIRDDLAGSLEPTDRAYLTAARAADTARRDRELDEARKLAVAQKEAVEAATLAAERQREVAEKQKTVARRTQIGFVAAAFLAVLAVGTAIFGFDQAREADRQAALAAEEASRADIQRRAAEEQAKLADAKTKEAIRNESVGLAALSNKELGAGRPVDATALALAAWPRVASIERPKLLLTVESLAAALPALRERVRLTGHEDGLHSAAFSPDGTRVVTASGDNTARVWDAATGAETVVLTGHDGPVWSAAFSPDGTRVVTASSDDNTARVWDVATGAEVVVLTGHESWVRSAAFSPDGTRVVTASNDKTARVWDAATGAEIGVLTGHEDGVQTAAFSPDGTRVVTASDDNTARVWDAATGAEIGVLSGHESRIVFAAFSPDGTRVVTASDDNTARVWDTATGAEIGVLTGHEDGVQTAAFSPDGTRVVT